jgi:hypothetical protein
MMHMRIFSNVSYSDLPLTSFVLVPSACAVSFDPRRQDAEFTIEFEQLAGWIADVKSAFNDELKEGGRANYRCLGLGYMW